MAGPGQSDRDEAQGGRRRVEGDAGRTEDQGAIGLTERLPGLAGDAFVVLPDIFGEGRIHRLAAIAGEEARGGEFQGDRSGPGDPIQCRGGPVAPAAQGIEQIGQSHEPDPD
jgi:hypothetical protein